ncbi:flavin reductase [Betaproteobacteria bacterium]|nr:flavin reductase [Betaproteobacteria bacterium]GHU06653.1 flavin reductase [Betaproteobacteria bacterium]GHU20906.1 flavin reductase [Betaproteobacteria bacterium]
MDTSEFRDAMSRLGAAVSVISTDGSAGRFGFTATAVTSVTDTPPTLLVCMNRASYANPHFKQNGVLCVNVLAGDQGEIAAVFANSKISSDERFARTTWETLKSGAPVMQEALVNFDCRIAAVHEVGTHSLFLCEIDAIKQGQQGSGLAYFNRAYHALHDGTKI